MVLSIVIPAYNEKNNILKTLERITRFLNNKDYSYEIIIVDDASKDRTIEVVENFSQANHIPIQILKNEINFGKGLSVKKGVLLSKGEFVLFTDADLSTPIEEIDKLLPYIRKGYDVVIGSRALKDSSLLIRQPWYRENMGKIFNLFVQVLIMRGIKDTQCGFKLFKNEVAKMIFSKTKINRFAFDVEVLLIARKLGFKIKEVGVIWLNSFDSKIHIIEDSFRMLIELFLIFIYNLIGKYKNYERL
ncbi:MAG: glycosyltransferase family 2 protein [Candidatus Omnitrophica bacterium]|nr:glycosyltransferase family 2 protein [Candidatus Omnitrophota bacterium]